MPKQSDVALTDRRTRRALAFYWWRAVSLLAVAAALLFLWRLLITPDGNTRHGIPDFVPIVVIVAVGFAALLGVGGMVISARMFRVLRAVPWREVSSQMGKEAFLGPYIEIDEGGNQRRVVLVAIRQRWFRFTGSSLRVAQSPGRSGVMTTDDFRTLGWVKNARR